MVASRCSAMMRPSSATSGSPRCTTVSAMCCSTAYHCPAMVSALHSGSNKRRPVRSLRCIRFQSWSSATRNRWTRPHRQTWSLISTACVGILRGWPTRCCSALTAPRCACSASKRRISSTELGFGLTCAGSSHLLKHQRRRSTLRRSTARRWRASCDWSSFAAF